MVDVRSRFAGGEEGDVGRRVHMGVDIDNVSHTRGQGCWGLQDGIRAAKRD